MLFLHPRLHHYQRSRFASLFLTVLPTVCFVVPFLGWCVTGLFQTYRLLYYSRTESAINIERLYITTNHLMDFLAPQRFLPLTRYNIFLGIATIVANSAQNERASERASNADVNTSALCLLVALPPDCVKRQPPGPAPNPNFYAHAKNNPANLPELRPHGLKK